MCYCYFFMSIFLLHSLLSIVQCNMYFPGTICGVFVAAIWCVMFLNSVRRSVPNVPGLASFTKKSLFFFRGQYDIAYNTMVTWNWEEPQVVGKTMTFNIRVSDNVTPS